MDIATGASIIALLVSLWTLYTGHLKEARLEAYIGDSLDIVRHSEGNSSSIQLACVFANLGCKVGVINKLMLKLYSANGECRILKWSKFVKQSNEGVNDQENVRAIPLLGKDVSFQRIQFSTEKFNWSEGRYKIELQGWFNKDCTSLPNIQTWQFFTVDSGSSLILSVVPSAPNVRRVCFENYD